VLSMLEIVPHRNLVTDDFSLPCEFQIARVRRHGAAIEDPAALTADLVGIRRDAPVDDCPNACCGFLSGSGQVVSFTTFHLLVIGRPDQRVPLLCPFT
jgi:hypothetical protein